MPTPYETTTGSWLRPTTFFWAAVGATAGLGNLWQFPYLAGKHGGSLFLLLYLVCLVLVTLPLMVTEAAIGRHARHGTVLAFAGLVRLSGRSSHWVWVGRINVLAAFLVLSFTAVIGAVCLAWIFYGAFGRFSGGGEQAAASALTGLVADSDNVRMFMAWHGFFLLLVVGVSMQGVVGGLERVLRALVPTTLLLMLGLLVVSSLSGDLLAASQKLLGARPEDLSWASLWDALFHAFYTLALGMGVWVVFGAYSHRDTRLKRSVLAVVLTDTLMSVVAGLMLYGFVGDSIDGLAEHGFRLLFVTLPAGLSGWPLSQLLTAVVFLVVLMLVWTTSLAWMEPVVGWFREWTGAPRPLSAFLVGGAAWLMGLGSLLSFNLWSSHTLFGGTFFRWLELVTSGLLIPLVSFCLAVFAGWCLTRSLSMRILGKAPGSFRVVWLWVTRIVLPVVILVIAVQYTRGALEQMCGPLESPPVWCDKKQPSARPDGKQERPAPPVSDGARPRHKEEPGPSEAGGAPAVRNDPEAPEGQKDNDIIYDSV
jgi:NSS family neurotransmitter:Na+ symporter